MTPKGAASGPSRAIRQIGRASVSWLRSRCRTAWGALRDLVGLALPADCAGCDAPGPPLCPACRQELSAPAIRVAAGGVRPTWAGAAYAGPARHVVVAWKDRGRGDLTRSLAEPLTRAVVALLTTDADLEARSDTADPRRRGIGAGIDPPSGVPPGRKGCVGGAGAARWPVMLVPVPSRRGARRRRGADVVLQLALAAARRSRWAGVAVRVLPALELARPVADQAGLSRAGRAENLSGAMRLRSGAARSVEGRRCIVVDDVVTTGATAREALRVLAEAGAIPLGAAAACATPLRRGLSGDAHLD